MKNDTMIDPNENIKKLGEMIEDIEVAMLTTVDPDGSLKSRPMVAQQVEFDGDLWFISGRHSTKMNSIQTDQHVNVSFASPDDNRYISITGRAEVIEDREKAKQLWNPLYKAWFPKGPDDPELTLVKVSVDSAEYWDSPSGGLVHLVGFAKAALTGKPYQASPKENQSMDLKH